MPDQRRELWVPLRQPGSGSTPEQQYDFVRWNPNFLPYASDLELDLEALNRHFLLLSLEMPLEILNLRSEISTQFEGSLSRNGELTSNAKRVKKPNTAKARLDVDQSSQAFQLRINFQEVAEELEARLHESKSEQFRQEFGQRINQVVMSQRTKLVWKNYLYQLITDARVDDGTVLMEGIISLFKAIVSIVCISTIAGNALFAPEKNSLKSMAVILGLMVAAQTFLQLVVVVTAEDSFRKAAKKSEQEKESRKSGQLETEEYFANYAEYIHQEIAQKRYLSLIICSKTMKYFNLPLLRSLVPGRQIIRGRK